MKVYFDLKLSYEGSCPPVQWYLPLEERPILPLGKVGFRINRYQTNVAYVKVIIPTAPRYHFFTWYENQVIFKHSQRVRITLKHENHYNRRQA
jgi:hypothetical protein